MDEPQRLTITGVGLEDEGWYTCIASNTLGRTTVSHWIIVNPGTSLPPGRQLVANMSLTGRYLVNKHFINWPPSYLFFAAPNATAVPLASSESSLLTTQLVASVGLAMFVVFVAVIVCLLCQRRRHNKRRTHCRIPRPDVENPFYARYNEQIYVAADEWEFDRKL